MSLVDLRRHLELATQRLIADPPAFGRPEAMRNARLEMQTRCGSVDARTDDRVARALEVLRRVGPQVALANHCRWICWGLTKPMPGGGTLLTSKTLFPPTLQAIRDIHAAGCLSMSAWRGLVDGYFTPNSTLWAQAAENWNALRDFLAASLPDIRARSRAVPDWLEQLAAHSGLLGHDPCTPFAADVLAGKQGRLDVLREALMIGQTSWFWEHLILAQVEYVTTMADQPFQDKLGNLLPVVGQYPAIVNDSLVALLTRYHRSAAHESHEGLKALSVEQWGSPNLITQASWNKVEPPVKRMVQEWLVREDLLDFFNIRNCPGHP